ncbi:MAG: hypothetical protein ABI321_21000 [Polyangia bacterium]
MRGVLLTMFLLGCQPTAPQPGWSDAQAEWQARRPHAWDTWRKVAAGPDGAEASRRLAGSAQLYESGVAAFERGDERATQALRAAAEVGPIEPSLYLRLARACRARGATVRAADFYRKLIAERSGVARLEAERELAEIDRDVVDPFEPANDVRTPYWPFALGGLLVAATIVLLLRRRSVDVQRILEMHPERAVAFAYQVGVLRHELFKHGLRPLRDGDQRNGAIVARAWRAHVDDLGLLLGLSAGWVEREPSFAAVDRAIERLARGQHVALDCVDRLEQQLVAWVRLAKHTRVDGALLDRIVESLRDEHPGRRLAAELVVRPAMDAPLAAIYEHDLALVLRNLLRNAVEAAPSVLLEVHVHVDDAGREWVRIGVHDPSTARPRAGASDRGLGIVRATLERYGGALLDGAPAPGFAKAVVLSIPAAEEAPVAGALARSVA